VEWLNMFMDKWVLKPTLTAEIRIVSRTHSSQNYAPILLHTTYFIVVKSLLSK
jgi:hypothetical protein